MLTLQYNLHLIGISCRHYLLHMIRLWCTKWPFITLLSQVWPRTAHSTGRHQFGTLGSERSAISRLISALACIPIRWITQSGSDDLIRIMVHHTNIRSVLAM